MMREQESIISYTVISYISALLHLITSFTWFESAALSLLQSPTMIAVIRYGITILVA